MIFRPRGRSSLLFQLLRPFPPEWSGIAKGASHPHANPRRDFLHTLERQAEQLRMAGVPMEAAAPDLSGLAERARAARFGLKAPYALLVPGGSPHRPGKRWPAENYGALAADFAARGVQPVLIGGPAEAAIVHTILAAAPAARSLVGETDFLDIIALGAGGAGGGRQRHRPDAPDRRRRRAVPRPFRPRKRPPPSAPQGESVWRLCGPPTSLRSPSTRSAPSSPSSRALPAHRPETDEPQKPATGFAAAYPAQGFSLRHGLRCLDIPCEAKHLHGLDEPPAGVRLIRQDPEARGSRKRVGGCCASSRPC